MSNKKIDELRAALRQAIAVANLELEAGLDNEYCPHGALWGTCVLCPGYERLPERCPKCGTKLNHIYNNDLYHPAYCPDEVCAWSEWTQEHNDAD